MTNQEYDNLRIMFNRGEVSLEELSQAHNELIWKPNKK